MFRPFVMLALALPGIASAWGPEGHSIVAEIAARRLTPAASATVERLLGRGHSLASVGSWADDARDQRPETSNWHFVDIPIARSDYDPALDCAAAPKGDCVVAELDRLKSDLRCAANDDLKREALKFAVHFAGDIHQPLHTVKDERGGNSIAVGGTINALKCTRSCVPLPISDNFHVVWDTTLITSIVWDWGAYVDRLEDGWLKTDEAKRLGSSGGPTDWAAETHGVAQVVWNALPADRALTDAYYKMAVPILDKQLGVAGLRLARFLNDAYSSTQCSQ